MKQVEEAGGAVAGAHMRMGDADDEILRHCEEHGDIGLLVMGSRGLGPIKRRLMGASPRASSATPTARSWWHAVRAVRVFGVASFLAKAHTRDSGFGGTYSQYSRKLYLKSISLRYLSLRSSSEFSLSGLIPLRFPLWDIPLSEFSFLRSFPTFFRCLCNR